MKHNSLFVLAIAALGACAPAATEPVSAPAPVSPPSAPAPAPEAQPAPAPAPEPDEVLAAAPDNWWLLDEAADGVPGISAARAYDDLLAGREPAQTVVVAIIDSGVDDEH